MPMAMMGDSESEGNDLGHQLRLGRRQHDEMMQEEEDDQWNMEENLTGKISQWISEKKTINFI